MATIPAQTGPTVLPSVPDLPNRSPAAPEGTFGETSAAVTSSAKKLSEQFLVQAAESKLANEMIALNDWELNNVFDPEKGFLQRRGDAAVSIMEDLPSQYDKFVAERRSQLSGRIQEEAFDRMAADRRARLMLRAAEHVDRETEVAWLESKDALSRSNLMLAAGSDSDNETFSAAKANADIAEEKANRLGWSDDKLKRERSDAISDAFSVRLTKLMADKSLASRSAAVEFFDSHKQFFNQEATLRFEPDIRRMEFGIKVDEGAAKIYNKLLKDRDEKLTKEKDGTVFDEPLSVQDAVTELRANAGDDSDLLIGMTEKLERLISLDNGAVSAERNRMFEDVAKAIQGEGEKKPTITTQTELKLDWRYNKLPLGDREKLDSLLPNVVIPPEKMEEFHANEAALRNKLRVNPDAALLFITEEIDRVIAGNPDMSRAEAQSHIFDGPEYSWMNIGEFKDTRKWANDKVTAILSDLAEYKRDMLRYDALSTRIDKMGAMYSEKIRAIMNKALKDGASDNERYAWDRIKGKAMEAMQRDTRPIANDEQLGRVISEYLEIYSKPVTSNKKHYAKLADLETIDKDTILDIDIADPAYASWVEQAKNRLKFWGYEINDNNIEYVITAYMGATQSADISAPSLERKRWRAERADLLEALEDNGIPVTSETLAIWDVKRDDRGAPIRYKDPKTSDTKMMIVPRDWRLR